jgi:hypothetical protein
VGSGCGEVDFAPAGGFIRAIFSCEAHGAVSGRSRRGRDGIGLRIPWQ